MSENMEYSAQWQGNNEFYGHLYKIADKMFTAKIDAMINVSKDAEITIINMQCWYECLKTIYFVIRYALKDEEAAQLQKITDNIELITEKMDFIHAQIDQDNKADSIRNNLEKLEYEIWFYLGKYNFLVKRENKKVYDSIEEQIEDENV